MTSLPFKGRTLAVAAIGVVLLGLLVFVAVRSGPLAPVAVTWPGHSGWRVIAMSTVKRSRMSC